MGILRMGPPDKLLLLLKEKYGISIFIETGTFKGETALWASKYFQEVVTIELSKELFYSTNQELKNINNIVFYHGDSRTILKEQVVAKFTKSAIFWLDAHFCSLNTAGGGIPCPLLDELDIIHSYKGDKYIFIDDARLFLSPPPKPHPLDEYPAIWDVLKKLQIESSNYNVIFEDVIISVPLHARPLVEHYCQDKNTSSDKLFWDEKTKSDFKIACEYFKKGIIKFLKQRSLLLR